MFWPGINASIANSRMRCKTCNTTARSQAVEPPMSCPPPQYPFEQVCADYFELGGKFYLAMADRYSGWLSVKFFNRRGDATASMLVDTLREWFMTLAPLMSYHQTEDPFQHRRFCESRTTSRDTVFANMTLDTDLTTNISTFTVKTQ